MVLLTGASGLLGQALTRQLLLDGKPLRLLLRDLDSPGFEGLPVERVQGNVTDPDSLIHAFKNIETVYHTAALPTNLPGMYDHLYHVNVQGTRNVIEACRACGVRNLVYVANFQAIGPRAHPQHLEPIREDFGFGHERALSDFGRTMAFACELVAAAHNASLNTMILLPSYQLGPFDYKLALLGRFIWDFSRGRVPVLTHGGFEVIDTRDVANAAVQATARGVWGNSYLLSNCFLKVEEFIHWLEAMSGRDAPRLFLPKPILYPVALFMEVQYRLHGEQPILNRSALRVLSREVRVDSSRAREDFGFKTRPLEETFADTWRWLAEHYHLVKVNKVNPEN